MSKGMKKMIESSSKDIEMLNRLTPKETDIGNEPISSPEKRSSESIKKTLTENNESSNKYSRNANYVSYGMFLIALASLFFTYESNKKKSEYQEKLKELSLQIDIQKENNQKIIDLEKDMIRELNILKNKINNFSKTSKKK